MVDLSDERRFCSAALAFFRISTGFDFNVTRRTPCATGLVGEARKRVFGRQYRSSTGTATKNKRTCTGYPSRTYDANPWPNESNHIMNGVPVAIFSGTGVSVFVSIR